MNKKNSPILALIKSTPLLQLLLLLLLGAESISADDWHSKTIQKPTLYEYYTAGGVTEGLAENGSEFTLNQKPFVIYSGTLHYFRVLPERWRSTLRRYKAAGLNTVQFYVPWNLHEDGPERFDFGVTDRRLNLTQFLDDIRAEQMFAIIRPGPYICAEWEAGGLPSWLLRDPNMMLRQMSKPFLDRVYKYYLQVFARINAYQFSGTKSGGPIIAAQIENEYGPWLPHGLDYLRWLMAVARESGFRQLLFTSDNIDVAKHEPTRSIPSLLETANGNDDMYRKLLAMKAAAPNRPIYVSEFWTGWFDSWGAKSHNTEFDLRKFRQQATDILFRINGSINYYPFMGGTNFGFMNGANQGSRIVTSYDYDAPLTESGNYTAKYYETRRLYDRLVAAGRLPVIEIPVKPPPAPEAIAYGELRISSYYGFDDLLDKAQYWPEMRQAVTMEMLDVGPDYGQRYGFVLYRARTRKAIKKYVVTGAIADRGILLVDGEQIAITQDCANFSITIPPNQWRRSENIGEQDDDDDDVHYLDMLVENQGRADWGNLQQGTVGRKGISSAIVLDDIEYQNLTIYSLDFNRTFMEKFTGENAIELAREDNVTQPRLYNAYLKISEMEPKDTYLLLPGWTKGSVFVNGFNLGRYWSIGPQKSLYIPGPLLRAGVNRIQIFELHQRGETVRFIDYPILGKPTPQTLHIDDDDRI